MVASFEKIDYRLRPAKAIERKMIVETIRKLSIFNKVENYQYIGFGSIYFSDFSLFHKALGIEDMITIEHNKNFEERVKFNLPYSCIKVYCDTSNAVLPTLSWNKPTITWLDYDGQINSSVLNDINTVFTNAIEGSLFIITLNAHSGPIPPNLSATKLDEFRLDKLIEKIGEEKIPFGTKGDDLTALGYSKVLRNIVLNEINSNLKDRNKVLQQPDKLFFQQLFNFKYEDGARMLTIGGLILKNSQKNLITKNTFYGLDFLSDNEIEYKIEVPKLTFREVNYIDSRLHTQIYIKKGVQTLKKQFKKQYSKFLEEDDILKYSKIYRHYPNFTEAIL